MGFVIGVIVGTIVTNKSNKAKSQTPKFSIDNVNSDIKINQIPPNIVERLSNLDSLKSKGLTSDSEYILKRKEIIDIL